MSESIVHALPGNALMETMARVPLMSQGPVKATCWNLKQLLISSAFYKVRMDSGWGPEIRISRVASSKYMIDRALHLVEMFLHQQACESARIELEALEDGDKPSASHDAPYFKYAQFRAGGAQVPAEPMQQDLYLDLLDPKDGSERLREAWWAVARSIFDGTPVPASVRILALGARRHGGRSAYSQIRALVWTGSQCGYLICSMDPAYMDVSMSIHGGLSEEWMRTSLTSFLGNAKRDGTFNELLHDFPCMLESPELGSSTWSDVWEFDQDMNEDGIDEEAQEGYLDTIFGVEKRADQKSWSFGD